MLTSRQRLSAQRQHVRRQRLDWRCCTRRASECACARIVVACLELRSTGIHVKLRGVAARLGLLSLSLYPRHFQLCFLHSCLSVPQFCCRLLDFVCSLCECCIGAISTCLQLRRQALLLQRALEQLSPTFRNLVSSTDTHLQLLLQLRLAHHHFRIRCGQFHHMICRCRFSCLRRCCHFCTMTGS